MPQSYTLPPIPPNYLVPARARRTPPLIHPIRYKYIGVMAATVITIAAEHDLSAIRRKHGESIKTLIPAYLFQSLSIYAGNIHIEREAPGIFLVAAKNNMLSIGQKIRRPIGLAIVCDLP